MNKRVGIIGSAGIPANYGGFETLVENLVKELKNDFRFIVYCSSFSYDVKRAEYQNARLIYIPVKANGRSSILYDVFSIIHAINKVDILVVLGVGGAFLFPLIRLFSNKILVVNIDGLEWKRQKWGPFAKVYLRIQERIAVKFAHKVIADNEAIQSYILSHYNRSSLYAPYGSNHATFNPLNESTKTDLNIKGSDYFFSVCRIEPENNIHLVLDAFSTIPELRLIIVGNWKSSKYGRSLLSTYKDCPRISMLDPIYDLPRLDELRSNCLAYVHGHNAGGTNPSLVEAMNLGLAVIAWDVNYNRYTTENKALFFRSTSELKEILTRIKGNDFDLKLIAQNLRKVAQTRYQWHTVARQYQSILND